MLSLSAQPKTLVSPTTVLKQQKGNCFDYSVLLASLLIGVGYDAYCVCGYADQEVTLLNQMRRTCPLLQEKREVGGAVTEVGGARAEVGGASVIYTRILIDYIHVGHLSLHTHTHTHTLTFSPLDSGRLHRGESP